MEYVNSMYKIYLSDLGDYVRLLKNEIIIGNINNIKDPIHKEQLNYCQDRVDKIKYKIQNLDVRYRHEIRLYSYFYKHGYLSAKEKHIAENYLAKYKDNVFKYEKDFKCFDYKIDNKKFIIEERMKEMEEDFNENLE